MCGFFDDKIGNLGYKDDYLTSKMKTLYNLCCNRRNYGERVFGRINTK